MQIVYRAQDIAEAHIVAGMLESNNIITHVAGHYLQGGIGEVGVNNLANVQVNDDDYTQARELVLEYEKAGANQSSDPQQEVRSSPQGVYLVLGLAIIFVLFLIFGI